MSKSEGCNPTTEQKRAALEHVRYEIRQLALLYRARTSPPDALLNNARIETTVIHLNILIEFFETDIQDRYKDDVLAADYDFPVSALTVDRAAVERRNKEVAHLTYTRTARPRHEWGWDFDRLVPPVLRQSRAFIAHILKSAGMVEADLERRQWEEVAGLIDQLLARPVTVTTAATTEVSSYTRNATSTQDPQTVFVAIHPCTILDGPAEGIDNANDRAATGASTEVEPMTHVRFPSPWPIDRVIEALERGDTLAQLVAPNRSTGGHDVREHLLERLFGDIADEVFGAANVALRRQIRTTLGLKTTAFPGTAQPDVAVRRAGRVHICEVKSNRYDYDRFDCVLDSKPFREFLAKAGHVGPDPWEVEQDLIKLNQFPTLSDRVGSCLFLMVDAYRGSGRSWLRAFRDRATFMETVRTPLVRSWADRLLGTTQIVALKAPGASANLIVCEVHAWHDTNQDGRQAAEGPTL